MILGRNVDVLGSSALSVLVGSGTSFTVWDDIYRLLALVDLEPKKHVTKVSLSFSTNSNLGLQRFR